MLSWSTKRKFVIFLIALGALVAVFSIPIYSFLNRVPACTDGVQNGGELGVDCGGACATLCPFQTSDPLVLWSRLVFVREGFYDVIASVENPNANAGATVVPYSIKLYDDRNILVTERLGSTFMNPNERFVIFESNINVGNRAPTRAIFEFLQKPRWTKVTKMPPTLEVKNIRLERTTERARLFSTIVNNSAYSVRDVSITVLLFDESGNILSSSRTELNRLSSDTSNEVTFIFPTAIDTEPHRIEVLPRYNALLFSRK